MNLKLKNPMNKGGHRVVLVPLSPQKALHLCKAFLLHYVSVVKTHPIYYLILDLIRNLLLFKLNSNLILGNAFLDMLLQLQYHL